MLPFFLHGTEKEKGDPEGYLPTWNPTTRCNITRLWCVPLSFSTFQTAHSGVPGPGQALFSFFLCFFFVRLEWNEPSDGFIKISNAFHDGSDSSSRTSLVLFPTLSFLSESNLFRIGRWGAPNGQRGNQPATSCPEPAPNSATRQDNQPREKHPVG